MKKTKKFYYLVYEEFQDYNGYRDMRCDKFETKEEAEEEAKMLSNRQLYMNVKILMDV